MSNLSNRFVIERNTEKIKQLVRVGAIAEECEEAHLPLLEAAYWAEKGIIDIEKEKIMDAARKADKLADDKYAILKYLSDLGYITRTSGEGEYLRVQEKGIKRGEDRTRYVLKVVPPDWSPTMKELEEALEFASRVRKELIIGMLKAGGVTFLKISKKQF